MINMQGIQTETIAANSNGPRLTLEMLADAMAAVAASRQQLRIISGAPIPVDQDTALQCTSVGVMFIGTEVVKSLVAESLRLAVGPSSGDAAVDRVMGIEVEPWGSRADHGTLLRRVISLAYSPGHHSLLDAMMKGRPVLYSGTRGVITNLE